MFHVKHFVALDFETANSRPESACAIGLARFTSDGGITTMQTLLKPPPGADWFDAGNIGIHGIRPADVATAPNWQAASRQIVEFIGDSPIVAHNMAFDGSVLDALNHAYRLDPLTNPRHCTLKLARILLHDKLSSRRLPSVYQHYFGVPLEHHHEALADALAAGYIFARMLQDHGFAQLSVLSPPHSYIAKR